MEEKCGVKVKICGVTTAEAMQATVAAGASFVGLVFVPQSRRFVPFDLAAELATPAVGRLEIVGLFENPSDGELERALTSVPQLTALQLHADESPERAAQIKKLSGLSIIKAIRVASREDVQTAALFADVADFLLFDSRLPDAYRRGGTGHAFDWRLLSEITPTCPWFLAGGLTQDTVRDAIRVTGAPMVDVSSHVEERPGIKSPAKIRAFIRAATSI